MASARAPVWHRAELRLLPVVALVAVIAVAGAAMVVGLTDKGVRLTPDSFEYLGIADSLAHGRGYAEAFGIPGSPAETQFPPLYPTVLSASHLVGAAPETWVVWTNAALFGLLIAIVAAAVYDLSRSAVAAVFAAVISCTSAPLLHIYKQAWSEPTFYVFEAWALWMLARYATTRRRSDILQAAVATALAMLTRYAGLSLLLTGLGVIAVFGARGLRARIRHAALFTLVAGVPLGVWFIRNTVLVGHSATGRAVAYYSLGHRFKATPSTLESWIAPIHVPSIGLWWLIALVGAVLLALYRPPMLLAAIRGRAGRGVAVMLAFMAAYVVVLIASVSAVAPGVQFADRILSPALVAGIIAIALVGSVLYQATPRRRLASAAWILCAVLVAWSSVHNGRAEQRKLARQTSTLRTLWPSSDLIARIRALPQGTPIYSNLSGPLYFVTKRPVIQLPNRHLSRDRGANLQYLAQMGVVRRELQRNGGVVAEFAGPLSWTLTPRGYWPTPAKVKRLLALQIVAKEGRDAVLTPQ